MGKGLLLIVLTVFGTVCTSWADVKLGLKAGMNVSEPFSLEGNDITDLYAGFSAGLAIDIDLVGKLGLETALLFSRTSFNIDGENIEKISIVIPLNLKAKFSVARALGFSVAAGPYVNANGNNNLSDYVRSFESKTFGFGLNFEGGVILGDLQVRLTRWAELSSDYSTKGFEDALDDFDPEIKFWSVSVAFFF